MQINQTMGGLDDLFFERLKWLARIEWQKIVDHIDDLEDEYFEEHGKDRELFFWFDSKGTAHPSIIQSN